MQKRLCKRKKSILAAKKKETAEERNNRFCPVQKLRSHQAQFNFKENCVFCFGHCCTETEKRKPFSRHQKICEVMTFAFRKNVLVSNVWLLKKLDTMILVVQSFSP